MNASTPIDALSPADIRHAVAERYGQVAAQPDVSFNFPVGRAFAEAIGYPAALLATLPAAAVDAFAGVTYAHDRAALQPGETVLDLGCGAGLDALIAARAVGPAGCVLGVDYSAPMVALARDNARVADVTNLRVEQAAIEELPYVAESVDVVQANGVFNLSPEKERAVAEAWRVLRPGGRAIVAEITLAQALDAGERATLDDWFR
jgi:SAM-dependent methyltransferase